MRSNSYKTATEYLNPNQNKVEHTVYENYDDKYKEQNLSILREKNLSILREQNRSLLREQNKMLVKKQDEILKNNIVANPIKVNDNMLRAKWEKIEYESTANPEFWGSSFWLILHNGALRYPKNASNVFKNKMKGFIKGIPYMVPCYDCKQHAEASIDNLSEKELDEICSGQDKLFKFFVDFHNDVNKRLFKPIVTYEEAYNIYNGKVTIERLKYK
jgi:hypothetical protein